MITNLILYFFFFFNDTATTEIYTLSLHDALPICETDNFFELGGDSLLSLRMHAKVRKLRSEEHTSELQSRLHLVCRLLLEKKKNIHADSSTTHFLKEPFHATSISVFAKLVRIQRR